MVTSSWQSPATVETQLFTEAYRFEFYQAVRLLEYLAKEANSVLKVPVDLKYFSQVSTVFPASDIDRVWLVGVVEKVNNTGQRVLTRVDLKDIISASHTFFPKPGGAVLTWSDLKLRPPWTSDVIEVGGPLQGRLQRIELTVAVNFIGLAGAHGPLPVPYAELLLAQVAKQDFTLRDFLDIFNHRLVSLFYRARQIQRVGLETESPWRSRFSSCLLALMGLGTPSLQRRLSMSSYPLSKTFSTAATIMPENKREEDSVFDAPLLLSYAGLFIHQSRSLAALEKLLSDLFQVSVKIEPWLGQWRPLPTDQFLRLDRLHHHRPLKERPVLGTKVWDQQGKFGLWLGPLVDLPTFLDFLPEGQGFKKLCEITRLFVGPELDFEINLKLGSIPETCLHPNTDKEKPKLEAKLGRTAWLKTTGKKAALVKLGTVTVAKFV